MCKYSYRRKSLQWCHSGRDSISNHQPHDCLLNLLFRRRSEKTSKLRVTGLCAGNSPGTGEFPAQMASYAENVSIWWRHHVQLLISQLCICHSGLAHNRDTSFSWRINILNFSTYSSQYLLAVTWDNPTRPANHVRWIITRVPICWLIARIRLVARVQISWKPGALQWHYNGHDGVLNHQPHDCLLHRLFRRRWKKTSKLSNAGNVSIRWRHHDINPLGSELMGI